MNLFSRHWDGAIIGLATRKFIGLKRFAGFDFYPLKYYRNSFARALFSFAFILKALHLRFVNKDHFDLVFSPNPLLTGILAIIIGKLLNAKVLLEINGNFMEAFKYGSTGEVSPSLLNRIKDKIAVNILTFSVKRADAVKLLNEKQLPTNLSLLGAKKPKFFLFPDYVATKLFMNSTVTDGKYILFVGFPWYLKGVDILIRAFNLIAHKFPDYKLVIVGWCPEGKEYFSTLAKDNARIEFRDPVFHEQVPILMSACSLFVLPSRTEAMGRVLIEAMLCRKPVIGANVDGIPLIVKPNYNGLLFEKENFNDLASKMEMLLSDRVLSKRLGQNGFNYARSELNEECYIANYRKLIDWLP
jgi:glycosyltransferase involved in cell wall biosynthesis